MCLSMKQRREFTTAVIIPLKHITVRNLICYGGSCLDIRWVILIHILPSIMVNIIGAEGYSGEVKLRRTG